MNNFGISSLSVLSIKKEPSHLSETVSQILFGETYKIIEENKEWLKIITHFDNYEGWIQKNQHKNIDFKDIDKWQNKYSTIVIDVLSPMLNLISSSIVYLPAGSLIPKQDSIFEIEGVRFEKTENREIEYSKTALINYSKLFLESTYLWGGRTAMGFDCSGFIQIIFKVFGNHLPRNASQQAEKGTVINFLSEAKICDLLFFEDSENNINHVGMLVSNDQIIHCSGKVRIDKIDHNGIYNTDTQSYTHKLRIIKRVLDNDRW